MNVTACACANIALVKYWGKRDAELNLPAAGSLSLTLDDLVTHTSVTWHGGPIDEFVLNGRPQTGEALLRVSRFLDLVRGLAHSDSRARVSSENSFPTASGLASSSSAFAALALAATRAAGLDLLPIDLSRLARRGSGSAARSIFGGFVAMHPDGHAEPLAHEWDLCLVVATVGDGAKAISSRDGMTRTQHTSPLYPAFLATVADDLARARAAIAARDLHALGAVAERSALAMHGSAMAARPAVVYFRGATVEALHRVRELRDDGIAAYATIDAGPHVKVLCEPAVATRVAEALGGVPGITATRLCRPGGGVEVVSVE